MSSLKEIIDRCYVLCQECESCKEGEPSPVVNYLDTVLSKRVCAYCKHFDSNNDLEYAHEYEEGSDGWCLRGEDLGGLPSTRKPIYGADVETCENFTLDPCFKEETE